MIFDADKNDISYEGKIFDYIIDAHHRMIDNDEDGIVIIRTRDFETILENQYVQTHFDVFEMSSSGSKIEYDKFNRFIEIIYNKNEEWNLIELMKQYCDEGIVSPYVELKEIEETYEDGSTYKFYEYRFKYFQETQYLGQILHGLTLPNHIQPEAAT